MLNQPRRQVRRLDSLNMNGKNRINSHRSRVTSLTTPNFSSTKSQSIKRKRRWFKPVLISATIGVAAIILFAGGFVIMHSKGKFSLTKIAVSTAKAAIEQKTTLLKGESQDRTNIVVYGMTKDGLRTDSIMLLSYYYQEKKLVSVNIPRDLYVYDGYENDKMGEVYAYAVARQKKTRVAPQDYVASVLSKEYGIPIQYWIQFNMQGEVDLVNSLGGVDINVPNSFADYEYPNWDYTGYIRPAPSFVAGLRHMDGDTALIYSRSRHSLNNGEGTDFARSKRQTQVLQAVAAQAKSLGIVGNISQISHYLSILGNNVNTNMSSDEMVAFAAIAKNLDVATAYSAGNWATGNGFLCDSTSSYGAYITLYGVTNNCSTQAGMKITSKYRQYAQYFVQNILGSVGLTPTAFIAKANTALFPSPTTLSPATLK